MADLFTRELPTEPGDYWLREGEDPQTVRVVRVYLYTLQPTGPELRVRQFDDARDSLLIDPNFNWQDRPLSEYAKPFESLHFDPQWCRATPPKSELTPVQAERDRVDCILAELIAEYQQQSGERDLPSSYDPAIRARELEFVRQYLRHSVKDDAATGDPMSREYVPRFIATLRRQLLAAAGWKCEVKRNTVNDPKADDGSVKPGPKSYWNLVIDHREA